MSALIQSILEKAQRLAGDASAGGSRQYTFELMVDSEELDQAHKILASLEERIDGELERLAEGGCTNPAGHEWDKSLGEADEARLAGDWANDRITCVHCGADGDA